MIAEADKALGELVDTISHSPIWASSAVFVVEDDSQDGADHVAAHRIPALVISPHAKTDTVVSTRYDLVSVIRTMELMIGRSPLTLHDALATPMYDAFATTPVNLAPWTVLPAQVDLVARSTAASPAATPSRRCRCAPPTPCRRSSSTRSCGRRSTARPASRSPGRAAP
jgi:phospholipase C